VGVPGVSLLGPLVVDGDGARVSPRDRVILAALALHAGEVVSSERLAEALWGERPPASWSKVVPGCVMRLRRVFGAESIETTPHGYRLVLRPEDVDVCRFDRLVARGRELIALGEADRAAHVLGEALALWRGRPLVELEVWDEGRIEAARLDELRMEAEELRVDAALRAGRCREVLGEAQARVAEAPLRERRWELLALAQYQAGHQGEALRSLNRARSVLATELGVDPGPDLVAMEQAILRQDPALVARDAQPEPSPVCPYLGLVAYDVGDAESYFGRDADVADCLRRLATAGVLAVVGPSGSGKSSIVRAGVAAALERDDRRVVIVTPGSHPNDALTALSVPGPAPVLIVDQCEEAVSLCLDVTERDRFLSALVDHAATAPLILTIRADRLGDLSIHQDFARILEQGLHLLGPMREADLRTAIEGPAHQAGLLLEPGLIDLLVREVEGEPGALPLLSHALRQTWERREGRTLTVAGYRGSGGIRGAVAQTAEDIYRGMPTDQQPLMRDLFLRLVSRTSDAEPVANPVPRRTVVTENVRERLVERLVETRLVTSDDGVLMLAHESLARAWPRLRTWLDDDVEGQRVFRHLAAAADAWDLMGRPDAELYRGMRLTAALEWRDRVGPDLAPTERDFLDAAHQRAEAEDRATLEVSRRQKRSRRRRRGVFAGVVAVIAIGVLASAVAVQESQRADTATAAVAAERAGEGATSDNDVDRSLLLAVAGVQVDDSPETRANLLTALMSHPTLVASTLHEEPIDALAVNPVSGGVAIGGAHGGVAFLTGDDFDVSDTSDVPTAALAFRPDGRQLAVAVAAAGAEASTPGPVLLVDPANVDDEPVPLGGIPDGAVAATDLHYSADSRFIAASLSHPAGGGEQSGILVWDVAAPDRPVLQLAATDVSALAFDRPATQLFAVTGDPPVLTVYDVSTGVVRQTTALPSASVPFPPTGLDVSPDGTAVAVADDIDVIVMDVATSTERRLRGSFASVTTVAFSPDGAHVAAASGPDISMWDAGSGAIRQSATGHVGPVTGLAFSPDGAVLYSASDDRALHAWDVRGDDRLIRRTALVDIGTSAAEVVVSPDGVTVAYTRPAAGQGDPDMVRYLDVAAGRLGDPVSGGRAATAPVWRPPDWDHVASGDGDGFVRVRDWRSGALVAERRVAAEPITSVAYTPDGGRLLVGEGTLGPSTLPGAIYAVDAETLEPLGSRVALDVGVEQLVAHPDGRTVIVLLQAAEMATVDLVEGRVLYRRDLHFAARSAVVSPDGGVVAIVCENGQVVLLDAETGEWIRSPESAMGDGVAQAAYAPDGATFVTSGYGDGVGLWGGRDGRALGTAEHAGRPVDSAVAFLADGHSVLIASDDGAVYTFDTRVEAWIAHACTIAGRDLTAEEWRAAFGNRPLRETCPDG
jgi:DNA-binding SARP family transcriptional activator/WD40 repeat protein